MSDDSENRGHEESREVTVSLEQVEDFQFRVTFGEEMAELLMDEPEPVGEGRGPGASQVLSAAIGNCLSASLVFCLRKARVGARGLTTDVTTALTRNERGRLRVGGTRVAIQVDFDPEERKRMDRCLEMFEDYCVVTGAVRDGIEVEVSVLDDEGTEIHRSTGAVPAGEVEAGR